MVTFSKIDNIAVSVLELFEKGDRYETADYWSPLINIKYVITDVLMR